MIPHLNNVIHWKLFFLHQYRGRVVLIEWKKSKKLKSAIGMAYDAPLQLCAYLGALSFDSNYIQHKVWLNILTVSVNVKHTLYFLQKNTMASI